MSQTILSAVKAAGDNDFSAEQRRSYAVAAALEVIAAKAGQSGANATLLEREMGRLGEYADLIQAALKVE
ncbi:hypothetical protein [Pseudomonas sp. 6D_7.1_Bac1]|uniref:hypothetical protein n=1 Tax=Pseudomonas sp. 6D_7.1_Bac1 TaxID=2971615 RepID=UPI0021C7C3E2|nr:hypothetical protein [Pseudomonas sp. 6D_7.1_Bac1]MCU1752161.1 hypothetical protein [Pseudomonas sp. 6D_7.1_Bac1]